MDTSSVKSINDGSMSESDQELGCWKATKKCFSNFHLLPILLVFYSLIKETRICDPFMYRYQTEVLNFTAKELNGEVYIYGAYFCLISLIPVLLFTDLLLCKPTMYLEMLSLAVFRYTLVFNDSLFSQQVGQAMYGVFVASEVAFFSYIYGVLEKDQYQKLTSWTRAGIMAGQAGGCLLAQVILIFKWGDYMTLNVLALAAPCLALVVCVFLPRISWKTMVERLRVQQELYPSKRTVGVLPTTYLEYMTYRLRNLRSDFLKIYSNGMIRKWSFFWALSTCMSYQVAAYSFTLFGQVEDDTESPLYGFADAAYTFSATVLILVMNALPLDWDKWGELALVIASAIDAGLLFLFSQAQSIYPMYGFYIAYRSLYQVMGSISQWNIAKQMTCDAYGLVFGVNFFMALMMQSLLTRIVTDKRGLGMQVREAFVVYGALHGALAVVFLWSVAYSFVIRCWPQTEFKKSRKVSEAVDLPLPAP